MSSRAFRPVFNCISDRQVWTASARSGTKGDSQRLPRFGMILCEVLDNAYRTILYVPDSNCSCRWLRAHKAAHVLKLGSEIRVGRIVDDHEQFQRGLVPLKGNPVCHLKAVTAFKNHHILPVQHGTILDMPCLNGNNYTHRNCPGCRMLC